MQCNAKKAKAVSERSSLLVIIWQALLSSENVDPRLQRKALFLLADLAEQQIEVDGHISNGLDDKLLISVVKLAEADDLDTQEKVGCFYCLTLQASSLHVSPGLFLHLCCCDKGALI